MAIIYYTVEPGNTLWGIAQYYGTTVNDIARYNGLPFPDQIYPGQQIKIPVQEINPPKWYIVRPGDTLWNISQRYNVSVQSILDNNNISDPYTIYPGQGIRLYI
ncbi:MAG TPA: LysM peptidoglycan-binding domain-containing protein [Clostridiales bacterium]|nr:LysM peptidoglycan-binding domain-containing protein [Clostridiales bacterium]